jgi:Zn-dependent membrane protease YugP
MLVWVLLGTSFALGVLAQRRVWETFGRYQAVADRSGLTGACVARLLLDAHGLDTVRIEPVPGVLADHYDPETRTLRLSADVGPSRSVAAIGIAAHEVAHAYQAADGSRAYLLRRRIGAPLARLAPFAGILVFSGFWFGSPLLVALGCAYMAGLVVFSVVTLPVELEASRDAVTLLQRTGIARADELSEIREVLNAAALTYIAGIAQQLGAFVAILILAAALF